MKKPLRTLGLKVFLEHSWQFERCTMANDLYHGEPSNSAWGEDAAPMQARPMTPAIQDLIQGRLLALLGKAYRVALFGSEADDGSLHYHLQIAHEPTGLSLEHHDRMQAGFIDDIFLLATRMKAMLSQRETLARMGGEGQVRLLTWISDDINPGLLDACQQARHACEQALGQLPSPA